MKTTKERAGELVKQLTTAGNTISLKDVIGLLKEIADAPEPEPVAWLKEWAGPSGEKRRRFDAYPDTDNWMPNNVSVTPIYTAPPSMPPADLVRDAERYRWLRASIWYVGPDDLYADEAGGLENYQNENFSAENLDTKIDAAIERDKKGGAA